MRKHESLGKRNRNGRACSCRAVHIRQKVLTRTKEESAIVGGKYPIGGKRRSPSFFSRRLIFYGDIFSFDGSWYGLDDGIVELAHKITAGKADRGCSREHT